MWCNCAVLPLQSGVKDGTDDVFLSLLVVAVVAVVAVAAVVALVVVVVVVVFETGEVVVVVAVVSSSVHTKEMVLSNLVEDKTNSGGNSNGYSCETKRLLSLGNKNLFVAGVWLL